MNITYSIIHFEKHEFPANTQERTRYTVRYYINDLFIMTSHYVGRRNKPGRLQELTFNLTINIDKQLASSDKIRMPEHVLNAILRLYNNNPPTPVLFEIKSMLQKRKTKPQLHCGVLEFTADSNNVFIPYWMTYCLEDMNGNRIEAGMRMKFILVRNLKPLTFVKFRPLDKRFSRDVQTPRATYVQ